MRLDKTHDYLLLNPDEMGDLGALLTDLPDAGASFGFDARAFGRPFLLVLEGVAYAIVDQLGLWTVTRAKRQELINRGLLKIVDDLVWLALQYPAAGL